MPSKNPRENSGAAMVVLVGNMNSRGSQLAIRFAKTNNKPLLQNPTTKDLAIYIATKRPAVINVGGNRASANPDAYQLAYDLIEQVIYLLEG